MAKPVLYIMVGYPGAGKTTVAQTLAKVSEARHIWAGKERRERFHEEKYQAANSKKLYDQLNDEVAELLRQGQDVIYDTNFRFRRDRDHLRQIAAEAGADFKLVWVQVPRDVAERRAVEESAGRPTRLWGNMSESDFDRLSDAIEEPTPDENPIVIEGHGVDEQLIRQTFGF